MPEQETPQSRDNWLQRLLNKRPRLPYADQPVFALLLFTAFFVPLIFDYYTFEKFETIKVSVFCTAIGAALLFYVFEDNREKLRLNIPGLIFISLFLVWTVLSALFSENKIVSFFGGTIRFQGAIFFLGWAIYALLLIGRSSQEKLVFMFKSLIFAGLLISTLGILQSYGIAHYESVETIGHFLRPPSFLGNPNFSSMFVASILPFAMALFTISRNFRSKIYYGLTIFIFIFAIIIFGSRGTLFGVVVMLAAGIVLALISWRQKAFGSNWNPKRFAFCVLSILFLGLLLYVLFIPPLRPNIDATQQLADDSATSRLQIWNAAVVSVKDRPWLGFGPGNFKLADQRYKTATVQDASVGIFDDAHNLFLNLAATLGLPTLASFVALIISALIAGYRKLRLGSDWLTYAAILGLLNFIVSANFTPVSAANWILLAILIAALMYDQTKKVFYPRAGHKAVAVGCAVVLLVWGLSFAIGEHVLYQGMRAYVFSKDYKKSKELFKAALTVNPFSQKTVLYLARSEIGLKEKPDIVLGLINKAVVMSPADALSYTLAADLYYSMFRTYGEPKYLDASIDYTKKAQRLYSEDPVNYGRGAYFYYQKKDYDSARFYLSRTLQIQPANTFALLLMTQINAREGKVEQTISYFKKLFVLRSEKPGLRRIWTAMRDKKDISGVLEIPLYLTPID